MKATRVQNCSKHWLKTKLAKISDCNNWNIYKPTPHLMTVVLKDGKKWEAIVCCLVMPSRKDREAIPLKSQQLADYITLYTSKDGVTIRRPQP